MKKSTKKQKRFAMIVALLAIFSLGAALLYFFLSQQAQKTQEDLTIIGFSIGTLQEERWQKDRDEWMKNSKNSNVSIFTEYSNNNAEKQIAQIERMIVKGVDVLVIVPYDSASLTEIIKKAHNAGIKVLSYDRLILNSNVDLYLSFDNEKVGEYEAQYVINELNAKNKDKVYKIAYVGGSMTDNNAKLLRQGSYKVLQPLIDSGKVTVVFDKFTADWNPENAYSNVKNYLETSAKNIDAVIAANDGTAGGAIKALTEYNLDGKVLVSGQDAELAACQRIVKGTQLMTVYKPIPKLAKSGIELAVKLAKGERIVSTSTVNDGTHDVPSVLLEPIAVTKENIGSTVIKDGYQEYNKVYGQ